MTFRRYRITGFFLMMALVWRDPWRVLARSTAARLVAAENLLGQRLQRVSTVGQQPVPSSERKGLPPC